MKIELLEAILFYHQKTMKKLTAFIKNFLETQMTQMMKLPSYISSLPTVFPNMFKQRVKTARAPAFWMNNPKIKSQNNLEYLRSTSGQGDDNLSNSSRKTKVSY